MLVVAVVWVTERGGLPAPISGIRMAAGHIYERNLLRPARDPFKFHDCAHGRRVQRGSSW